MDAILSKITQLESNIQLLTNQTVEYKKEFNKKIDDLRSKQKHEIKEKDVIIQRQNNVIDDLRSKLKISTIYPKTITVKYVKTQDSAEAPKKGGKDPRNIGYDIWAEFLESRSQNVYVYAVCIACEPPDGYYLEIQERSSFRVKYPGWVGAIGTIDGGYRGAVHIVMTKIDEKADELPKRFNCFQVIARPEIFINWVPVDKLSESIRGVDGFGSTDENKVYIK